MIIIRVVSSSESSSISSSISSAASNCFCETPVLHLSSSVAGGKNESKEVVLSVILPAWAFCLRFPGDEVGLVFELDLETLEQGFVEDSEFRVVPAPA